MKGNNIEMEKFTEQEIEFINLMREIAENICIYTVDEYRDHSYDNDFLYRLREKLGLDWIVGI